MPNPLGVSQQIKRCAVMKKEVGQALTLCLVLPRTCAWWEHRGWPVLLQRSQPLKHQTHHAIRTQLTHHLLQKKKKSYILGVQGMASSGHRPKCSEQREVDCIVIERLSRMGLRKAATSYCWSPEFSPIEHISPIQHISSLYKTWPWITSSGCIWIHLLTQEHFQCSQPVPNR